MRTESAVIYPESWTAPLPLERYFDPAASLEVDLGCGKGRFLTERARTCPGVSFLGVDRKLSRIRKTDRKVVRAQLRNVRLLRVEAAYLVEHLLPQRSVRACYVLFPDPWPKRRHHRRRLITPRFVRALHGALEPAGCVHLATDHLDYFERIAELFGGSGLFEPAAPFAAAEAERSEFETLFVRREVRIGRCSFRSLPRPSGGSPRPRIP